MAGTRNASMESLPPPPVVDVYTFDVCALRRNGERVHRVGPFVVHYSGIVAEVCPWLVITVVAEFDRDEVRTVAGGALALVIHRHERKCGGKASSGVAHQQLRFTYNLQCTVSAGHEDPRSTRSVVLYPEKLSQSLGTLSASARATRIS